MASTDSKVLGVVVLVRHGDRHGFYQSPSTYTPSNTILTPLGNQQEFQLGQKLRSLYLDPKSPDYISGINSTLVNDAQFRVRADAGGEGGVILNSAQSLLQGLYPANPGYNTTLANGTTITGPLGGYQYIPIESVEPENDISLEGWTSCNTFAIATKQFYESPVFRQKAAEHDAFLKSLPPYLDGRPVTFENMWNVFDFMNVQAMHNAEFLKALPPTYLTQARDLANWHEYGVFSDQKPDGIGNIPGHTILAPIIEGFHSITNKDDPVKFVYQAISYKPFISLFNLTGAAEANPQLAGIVNFAASIAFEVRQPAAGGEPVLRLNFKNGTDDADYKTYKFFNNTGSGTDVPLSQFIDYMEPLTVKTTAEWCGLCDNNKDRGCDALHLAAATGAHDARPKVSSIGAGFIGAGVTIALALAIIGFLVFLGVIGLGKSKRSKKGKDDNNDDSSEGKA
ncbi:histidine phosphatase superfamily [Collybia nuda]|uniref:Histidine phosphatase superfamily n=1 Tax=Collybia nuda TaxID=64659 RepID=A0A9P6CDJ9_9AGAR|nr:histidine phosphatase superfamily [Collybia nuda]